MAKIKAYQQLEYSDCGITCLRIVARYYGQAIPLKTLRRLCDTGRMGTSLRELVDCSRKLGFRSEAVKLSADEVWRVPLPAVLFWKQHHYVVLYEADKSRGMMRIVDPSQGKVKLKKDIFYKHWMTSGNRGLAVVLEPTDEFYSLAYEREENWYEGLWQMLRTVVCNNRLVFSAILLLTCLAMIADVLTPMLFQRTVDEGIQNRDLPLVWMLVAGQFAVFFGNYMSNSITDLLLTRTGLKVSINMMNDYLSKLISLPIAFFDRKVNSDFIQKIDDQNRIKNFLLTTPDMVFFTVVNLVVFSAMLIYYSIYVFGVFLVGTMLSALWTQLHLRRRKAIDFASFSYASENKNNVYELVNGMSEIKINNAQHTRVAVWNKVQRNINKLSMKSALVNLSINGGNVFFARMKDICIIGLCATMVVRGNMTIGEMMTISYITGRLAVPFANIEGMFSKLQDASMSYERIEEIVDYKENGKATAVVDKDNLSLRFDNVSFKYPGAYSPFVIRHLTAVVEQGKTTAIVGASGCGKTTLLKLILGFYVPQDGIVMVGGINMAELDNEEWLRCCGVVMQNGYIFSGTVMENIALADPNPDEEKVREAARIACIDDFFEYLPMGYHTRLGNTGVELSGGQKQRLFIARAVYKNPKLLLLDEATSSLDANNESAIIDNLSRYNKGRTVVVAAHRLSTVRHADKIIYMERGTIMEEGSHEELLARHGAYYRLVKEQIQMT